MSNRQRTMSLFHRRPIRRQQGYVPLGRAQVVFSWRWNLVKLRLMPAQVKYLGEFRTQHWDRGFAALSRFRAREGHCCPPRRYVEGGFDLGQWVAVQRYRKELLSVERKQRLNRIGFVWDWRSYRWEQNFAALLKFKRRKGHCCVPTFHREGDLKLGWWVATQRRKRKEMSAERRARLNKIGFVWRVETGPIAHQPKSRGQSATSLTM
jgi:Helicase associated domain